MASGPKTIGFNLNLAKGGSSRGIRRTRVSREKFATWVGSRPAKPYTQVMQENYDRNIRVRPLALLNRRNANSLHSNDMGRLNNRPGTRPRTRGASLDAWKSQAVAYNGALSRQQMMNPDNRVLGGIKPLRVSTRDMSEIPVVKMYAERGGRMGTVTPVNTLPQPAKPSTQIV